MDNNALLSGLNAKKLKTTKTNDRSGPKLGGFMPEKDVLKHQEESLHCNIEEWYKLIEPYTFETEFMELTREHAKLFIKSHSQFEKDGKFSPEVLSELASLCGSLQAVIETMKGDGGSTFVKASSRSAKDTPISSKLFLTNTFIRFFKSNQEVDNWPDEDAKMKALLQAATEMLRITDAKQAIDCFAKSERIAFDMGLALEVDGKTGKFEENFVVRKWHNIAVDMEFRGFVYGGKLVALSQYNHMFASPRLLENRDHLLKIMTECFDKVKGCLEGVFDNYIIDFAITGKRWSDLAAPSEEEERVWIIELNPYHFSTDATLFSWKQEYELMSKGREDGKIEFRLREKFDPAIFKGIKQDWRELVKMDLS